MTSHRTSAALRRPKAQDDVGVARAIKSSDVIIGKDVLELVSTAMYIDPIVIYREYLQNAADAVDDARHQGLLSNDEAGRVHIDVDGGKRFVRLRDNGCGIAWDEFVPRLTAIGASRKRGTDARGFRGIGRLAGLGYAQEVVFRSRAKGEQLISELTWDCRKLRAALRSAQSHDNLSDLIRDIVSVDRTLDTGYPEHFFEVELRGVVRLRSDKMMNPAAIAEYLGQVAPVPFSPEFSFGPEIRAALKGITDLNELEVTISGFDGPVYRPHRDTFAIDEKKSVPFDGLEIVEAPGLEGGVAGLGWILHHEYEGAVPASSLVRGLRFRSGNIQIGDNNLLEELFPETRFNAWAVGEIHVTDKRIVPNGRRDHFEQDAHFNNLVNYLAPAARGITKRCRTNSVRRKWLREFEAHKTGVTEKLDILGQGSIGRTRRDTMVLSVEQALLRMRKVAEMDLFADGTANNLIGEIDDLNTGLTNVLKEVTPAASPLARLSPKKRDMYEHLFELIYECSANRTAAKSLVDRILVKVLGD